MKALARLIIIIIALAQPALAGQWMTLTGASQPQPPKWTALAEDAGGLLIQVEINGYYSAVVSTPQGDFQRLELMPGFFGSQSEPGAPELPFIGSVIRLPDGFAGKVSVVDAEWRDAGHFRLYPRQFPAIDDGKTQPAFTYNTKAYTLDEWTPFEVVRITEPQGWSGIAVAGLSVTPLQYKPSDSALKIARRMTLRVDLEPSDVLQIVKPSRLTAARQRIYANTLLNPLDADPRRDDTDEAEPFRMLVVLKREALDTALPLINFHHRSGTRVQWWLLEGNEEPIDIKNRIRQMYRNGLQYVLFIGDGYMGNLQQNPPDIPMPFWDQDDPGEDFEPTGVFSDSWYVCLDSARNGFDDHLPDLAIARLVYDGPNQLNQLQTQISKLMRYMNYSFEQIDDGGWMGRELLMSHREINPRNPQDTTYYECKRTIELFDYQSPHPEFIAVHGIRQGTNAMVRNAVNNISVGFFNYRGHGIEYSFDVWNNSGERWWIPNVQQLTNVHRPFLLVISACLCGNYADYDGDCIAEAFQKHSGGAFMTHGCIESTYTDGNSFFDIAFHQALFDDGVHCAADASNAAVVEMVLFYDNDRWPCIGRFNTRAYAWQGDPALEYRLAAPRRVSIQHPPAVPVGTRQLDLRVWDADDNPAAGVRVTALQEGNNIYYVEQTDNNGNAHFEFEQPLEGPDNLYISAYCYSIIPNFDTLLVANGFGVVEGLVMALHTGRPIAQASVRLSRFDVEAHTDVNGFYRIEGVPTGAYQLTVTAPGWLGQVRDVEVSEGDSTRIDFQLRFSELTLELNEVAMTIPPDGRDSVIIPIRNTGNGPLHWTATVNVRSDMEPLQTIRNYEASIEVGDTRLHGVVYANGELYIVGGNENGDPNYIYVIDPASGRLARRIEQPRGAGGLGLRDLAFDGQYLYGSAAQQIYRLTLDGQVVNTFEGQHNPNLAIACDHRGNLWIGNHTSAIYEIDGQGNVLSSIRPGLAIRALAWDAEAADGYRLLAFVRPQANGVWLYKIHPASGAAQFVSDLADNPDDTVGEGLEMTNQWDAHTWTLIGNVAEGAVKRIQLWNWSARKGWISIQPPEGVLEADAGSAIEIRLNARQFPLGISMEANLLLSNDGAHPQVIVPVTMRVSNTAAPDENELALPKEFWLSEPYPNPFNAQTTIEMRLPAAGHISITLFDIAGKVQRSLYNGYQTPGTRTITLDGEGLPSGIYLMAVSLEGWNMGMRKVILLK